MADSGGTPEGSGMWGWTRKLSSSLQQAAAATSEGLKVAVEKSKQYLDEQSLANAHPNPRTDAAVQEKLGLLLHHPRAPWRVPEQYYDRQQLVIKQIMLLTEERWTFLSSPPEKALVGWEWEFDAEAAQLCLELDAKLDRMRFLLVPFKVQELTFWRNYFARIHLIRTSILDPSVRMPKKSAHTPTLTETVSQPVHLCDAVSSERHQPLSVMQSDCGDDKAADSESSEELLPADDGTLQCSGPMAEEKASMPLCLEVEAGQEVATAELVPEAKKTVAETALDVEGDIEDFFASKPPGETVPATTVTGNITDLLDFDEELDLEALGVGCGSSHSSTDAADLLDTSLDDEIAELLRL